MAGLEMMNGAPVNMERERQWYKRLCELHGIDMQGAHFLLVPHGFDVNDNAWDVLHGETMTTINDYELDDGESVEDLAAHLRECMPGAEVQPPSVVGRVDVHPSNDQAHASTEAERRGIA